MNAVIPSVKFPHGGDEETGRSPTQRSPVILYQSVVPSKGLGTEHSRLASTWKFAAVPHTPCVCARDAGGIQASANARSAIGSGVIQRGITRALSCVPALTMNTSETCPFRSGAHGRIRGKTFVNVSYRRHAANVYHVSEAALDYSGVVLGATSSSLTELRYVELRTRWAPARADPRDHYANGQYFKNGLRRRPPLVLICGPDDRVVVSEHGARLI